MKLTVRIMLVGQDLSKENVTFEIDRRRSFENKFSNFRCFQLSDWIANWSIQENPQELQLYLGKQFLLKAIFSTFCFPNANQRRRKNMRKLLSTSMWGERRIEKLRMEKIKFLDCHLQFRALTSAAPRSRLCIFLFSSSAFLSSFSRV